MKEPTRLETLSESVYVKLLTRFGTPTILALLTYLGSTELGKISEALDTIPKLMNEQELVTYKLDQLKIDLVDKSSKIYSIDDAQKDWKLQNNVDSTQNGRLDKAEGRLDSAEKRIQVLEVKK